MFFVALLPILVNANAVEAIAGGPWTPAPTTSSGATPNSTTDNCIGYMYRNGATSKCFWMPNGVYTFLGANIACTIDGGMLATIDSSDQATFVNDSYPSDMYERLWLGMVYYNDTWTNWVGRPLSWFAWAMYQPSLFYPNIQQYASTLKWSADMRTGMKYHALCEKVEPSTQEPQCTNVTKYVTQTIEPQTASNAITGSSAAYHSGNDATIPLCATAMTCDPQTVIQTLTVYKTLSESATPTTYLHMGTQESTTRFESSLVIDPTGLFTPVTEVVSTTSSCTLGSYTAPMLSPDELQRKIEQIEKELKLDKNDLSSTRRKRNSASDSRTSCLSIGVCSVVLIAAIFLVLTFVDLPRYLQDLKNGAKSK